MITVAPTEPAALKVLGSVSMLPEQFGVDFLFANGGLWYGVQRKEYGDFVASVYDGRLAKELGQMKQVTGQAMLLLEGQPKFSIEGQWLNGYGKTQWSANAHHGYLWSVQRQGVWVDTSTDVDDTAYVIGLFQAWAEKPKHQSTGVRPGPTGAWGTASNKEWLSHLLQGFPGVGVELANRVIDKLGCPMAWTVTVEELMTVQGVGKKTAERLLRALEWERK